MSLTTDGSRDGENDAQEKVTTEGNLSEVKLSLINCKLPGGLMLLQLARSIRRMAGLNQQTEKGLV